MLELLLFYISVEALSALCKADLERRRQALLAGGVAHDPLMAARPRAPRPEVGQPRRYRINEFGELE